MKAVVTVIGCDRVGIIADVTRALADANVNIIDISQTILDNYFTMIMVVDFADSKQDFKTIQDMLIGYGKNVGLSIRVQRQDIFDAMHSITS